MFNPARAKSRRLFLDLTLREVGARVGVNASTVLRWERGERNPTADSLARLADALELPTTSLLTSARKERA